MGVGSAVALLALSRIGPSHCHQPERTDSPDQKISTGQAKLLRCMVPEYRDLNKADLISHSLSPELREPGLWKGPAPRDGSLGPELRLPSLGPGCLLQSLSRAGRGKGAEGTLLLSC